MKLKNLFSKRAFFAFMFVLVGLFTKANNVQITGTSVAGNNITFNIAWENSWNASAAPANWDAVWVFVKYQDCNTKLWNHVNLNVSGHSTSSPLQVDTVADNKGVFVRRSAVGGGNIAATSVTLSMNLPAGTYNFKVYGIEMVNIPQGAFQIGDAVSWYTYNSINIDATAQANGLTAGAIQGSYSQDVPNTFPMGYNSFYCMKYEISQEQYVDFLNSLTFTQQKNRVYADPISVAGTKAMYGGTAIQTRNGVAIDVPGSNAAIPAVFGCDATLGTRNAANDGQNVAMNFMSYTDLAAYLDWAALRPMTEMEFEKVCRGPQTRIAGEYAWGSTELTQTHSGSINNSFLTNETSSTTVNNGMCVYGVANATYGPLRVGALATSASGRLSAGAGYYGVMEMSGNVWERVVGTYYANGVAFDGTLGDGELDSLGYGNQATWNGNSDANTTGVGAKGGSFYDASQYLIVSDRYYILNVSSNVRGLNSGGRGVR